MTPKEGLEIGLAGFAPESPPERLFHFYGRNRVWSLQRGRLNLTPPGCFNDPFEFWAGITDHGMTESDVLRSVLAPNGLHRNAIRETEPLLFKSEDDYRPTFTSMVKCRPDLWSEHLESLVDSVRKTFCARFGVSCFSAFAEADLLGPIGIRHWATYADGHRGFAIEYEGRHKFFRNWARKKMLFPVEYREERLLAILSDFDEWNEAITWRTLRVWSAMKSFHAWGQEAEWRLVVQRESGLELGEVVREVNEEGEDRDFLPLWREDAPSESRVSGAHAIRRVILGVNASEGLANTMIAAAKEPHLRHVEVWKTRPCRTRFALTLERIH